MNNPGAVPGDSGSLPPAQTSNLSLDLEFAQLSDPGKQREHNEDSHDDREDSGKRAEDRRA